MEYSVSSLSSIFHVYFSFNDQSNKSINYDYWLFVRQLPNEQSSHKWFLYFLFKKKADLNWTKIRHSWLLLFKIIKYVDIRVQFWGWFGKKK